MISISKAIAWIRNLAPGLNASTTERMFCVFVGYHQDLLMVEEVGSGDTDYITVRLGELRDRMTKNVACGIILAHFHPSGMLIPSEEDLHLTHRVNVFLAAHGFILVDHLILSRNGFISLKARGII